MKGMKQMTYPEVQLTNAELGWTLRILQKLGASTVNFEAKENGCFVVTTTTETAKTKKSLVAV